MGSTSNSLTKCENNDFPIGFIILYRSLFSAGLDVSITAVYEIILRYTPSFSLSCLRHVHTIIVTTMTNGVSYLCKFAMFLQKIPSSTRSTNISKKTHQRRVVRSNKCRRRLISINSRRSVRFNFVPKPPETVEFA